MNGSSGLGIVALILGLLMPAVASADSVVEQDRERIREHLKQVEEQLRAKDVSHLSDEQKEAREANLDRLHSYWKAGKFPQNDVTDERTPIFIDSGGRECAVGHLMVEGGWDEEAEAIAERENLARLPEMNSPEVADWLEASGLTAEEATMIQPSYSPCRNCDCAEDPVCGNDGKTYINECTAKNCGNAEAVNEGCCSPSDDPITPAETDDPWAKCGQESSDAGDVGTDAGGSSSTVCSMSETTESPSRPPPPDEACSVAGHEQSPLGLGWLLLLIGSMVGLRRRN